MKNVEAQHFSYFKPTDTLKFAIRQTDRQTYTIVSCQKSILHTVYYDILYFIIFYIIFIYIYVLVKLVRLSLDFIIKDDFDLS